jgi:hypothetical protein
MLMVVPMPPRGLPKSKAREFDALVLWTLVGRHLVLLCHKYDTIT